MVAHIRAAPKGRIRVGRSPHLSCVCRRPKVEAMRRRTAKVSCRITFPDSRKVDIERDLHAVSLDHRFSGEAARRTQGSWSRVAHYPLHRHRGKREEVGWGMGNGESKNRERYISSTSSSTMVRFSAEKEMPMSVMRFPESAYLPAYSLPRICSIASDAGRSSLNSTM